MTRQVLVIDDDREIREIIAFVLQQYGCSVRTLSSGQRLEEALAEGLPDLIILDVMMPGADGFSLCTTLHNDPRTRTIPIMMMTAHAEDIYARISGDLGAAYHITKPFHPLEMAEKVMEILKTP